MTALRPCVSSDGSRSFSFWCPGCEWPHNVPIGDGPGPRWTFNDNLEAPTFGPSLLITSGCKVPDFAARFPPGVEPTCWCTYNAAAAAAGREPSHFHCGVCHSFVVDGSIQFLADCTHALAGQTVPIPPWPVDDDGDD